MALPRAPAPAEVSCDELPLAQADERGAMASRLLQKTIRIRVRIIGITNHFCILENAVSSYENSALHPLSTPLFESLAVTSNLVLLRLVAAIFALAAAWRFQVNKRLLVTMWGLDFISLGLLSSGVALWRGFRGPHCPARSAHLLIVATPWLAVILAFVTRPAGVAALLLTPLGFAYMAWRVNKLEHSANPDHWLSAYWHDARWGVLAVWGVLPALVLLSAGAFGATAFSTTVFLQAELFGSFLLMSWTQAVSASRLVEQSELVAPRLCL